MKRRNTIGMSLAVVATLGALALAAPDPVAAGGHDPQSRLAAASGAAAGEAQAAPQRAAVPDLTGYWRLDPARSVLPATAASVVLPV